MAITKKDGLSALMGLVIGIWLVFAVKHFALIAVTILCILALRYLFSEFIK